MSRPTRRGFLPLAAALGASAVWARAVGMPTRSAWREHREFFAEGVASGDPDESSVIVWTRREYASGPARRFLRLEVARDEAFQHTISNEKVPILRNADWTCRALVGGLEPSTLYWYRFTDAEGNGSRIGRTKTAPAPDADRNIRFAFVSCQNANQGAQNAYRRMIFEDQQVPLKQQLDFVLHLGDFIYELVWYPEDRPQGMYDRRLRDIVRYPRGEKIDDFHVPVDIHDYRAVYRAYLHDPDLQEARARWSFVSMWDNHEFSWKGWQGLQKFDDVTRPAQTRKVAANQAFFEFQPARISKPSSASLETFTAPLVKDVPVIRFDEHGLGQESNNLTAIVSLRGYRALRWGRHLDLIVTDQRSYRSEEPLDRPEAAVFHSKDFPGFLPEEAIHILDAGHTWAEDHPPDLIPFADKQVPNFRKDAPAQTILGSEQKAWFLERLKQSTATWKVWGNTTATLEMRADLQNLPAGMGKPWPGAGFAASPEVDHSTALTERGEIYDFVRQNRITGFATVAGDRHSFWAGVAAKGLPPANFDPVGVAFVVGSISAPGMVEALEHVLSKKHPLYPLYLSPAAPNGKQEPTVNLLLRHGVQSCLEYLKSGDIERARAVSNLALSPHLSFVDMGGHGYAVVTASADHFTTEFVCTPRPLERSTTVDGGPILYRVRFDARKWQAGARPRLNMNILEGNPKLSS